MGTSNCDYPMQSGLLRNTLTLVKTPDWGRRGASLEGADVWLWAHGRVRTLQAGCWFSLLGSVIRAINFCLQGEVGADFFSS